MVISIRRSRHEEGEELVAIWCRSVDATHDFLSAEYRTELEDLVRSFLPEAPLWVAVNERDQPVGFMLLSGQHMDALFIDPDVRGCGVGRVLVEHALSMAPELTTSKMSRRLGSIRRWVLRLRDALRWTIWGNRIRC